jgi:hypothetical protein
MQGLQNGAFIVGLAVAILAGLLLASALGGWLGRRLGIPDRGTDHGHVLGGILGLLALLVAFAFGWALDRYEQRRDLVVREANAIGTAAMRLQLLDAPHALRLTDTYRAYAVVRLDYGLAQDGDKPALRKTSEALRARIEAQTLAALAPIRHTNLAGSILAAVNESLDVGAAREAAQAARLPAEVLAAIAVYALVTAVALGMTLRGHRALSTMMYLLLTLSLSIIVDLDHPRIGWITVSQDPMARLVAELKSTPPP